MTDQLVPGETVVDAKYALATLADIENYLRQLPAKHDFEKAEYWANEVRLVETFFTRFKAEYDAMRATMMQEEAQPGEHQGAA
ncbi:MAG: hypothetical protein M1319_03295 [Chloroflexi bacterium]|nr:hypothetical protein [Chloroflexota bacterium]